MKNNIEELNKQKTTKITTLHKIHTKDTIILFYCFS